MRNTLLFSLIVFFTFSSHLTTGAISSLAANNVHAHESASAKRYSKKLKKQQKWQKRFDRFNKKLNKKLDRLKKKGKSLEEISLGLIGILVMLVGGMFIVLGLVIPVVGILFLIIGIIIAFAGLMSLIVLEGVDGGANVN